MGDMMKDPAKKAQLDAAKQKLAASI